MCGTNDDPLQLDLCHYKEEQQHHEDTTVTTPTPSHSCSSRRRSRSSDHHNSSVEKVWKETQQLMEDGEQLVRIMTHVCSQQFSSGAYRTLARYSQGCWRGCSAEESANGRRSPHQYVHPSPPYPPPLPPPTSHHPCCCGPSSSSSSSASPYSCQQMSTAHSCKGCCVSCGCSESGPNWPATTTPHHLNKHQHHHHLQEEESSASSSSSSSSSASCSCCRWRGGWGRRRRWRWCRCQCAQCRSSYPGGCSCCCAVMAMGKEDSGGSVRPPSPQPASSCAKCTTTVIRTSNSSCSCSCSSTTTTATTSITTTTTPHHHQCPSAPSCPTHATAAAPARAQHTSRRTPLPSLSQARSTSASPKPRGGAPTHPSLLTILLLLVVTLARFTDGCSSRSTPKPRPASPTMRPNITFQTFSCPPAYAAWYCLNGATCFTVKIGESILYNCECADGYMGQRCEFKDLDGSYLQAREKVLMETASIAGGATVACVLVFIVLFAVYVFMQKDKDKRCRDLDGGRDNDRQPFSGYQNPRPEIFRTISNPYARSIDELSHVEVESSGHGNSASGRNASGATGGGGGGSSMVDSNLHGGAQHQTSSPPTL